MGPVKKLLAVGALTVGTLTPAPEARPVVLVEHGGDVIVCRNTLRRRVRVRLLADGLDRDLAAGISPDATMEHSLRAQHLNSPKQRKHTARSLWRSLDDALGLAPNPVHPSVPISSLTRAAVLASAWEIQQIATRLSSAEPVSSQGLALARLLATDGAGPLHYSVDPQDLRDACHEVLRSLEPEQR